MNFAKLHGDGNDFLLFDGRAEPALADELPPLIARLCHRHFGVGADGVMFVVPIADSVARVVYWNSDGSEAAFCANGSRCAACFIASRWGWREMTLATGYAAVSAAVNGARVMLRLPAPQNAAHWQVFPAGGVEPRGLYLEIGVPHLVVPVDWPDFWERPLTPLAPALRSHPALPKGGANISFLRAEGGGVSVRSWERGVEGETLSCGSGAAAAALVFLAERWITAPVVVRTASGRFLTVEPEGAPLSSPVRLYGLAEWVAEGTVRPELLAGQLN